MRAGPGPHAWPAGAPFAIAALLYFVVVRGGAVRPGFAGSGRRRRALGANGASGRSGGRAVGGASAVGSASAVSGAFAGRAGLRAACGGAESGGPLHGSRRRRGPGGGAVGGQRGG